MFDTLLSGLNYLTAFTLAILFLFTLAGDSPFCLLLIVFFFRVHLFPTLEGLSLRGGRPIHTLAHSPGEAAAPRGYIMEGISVVSMNVNGLNMPNKRRILFDHFRRSKADFIFLQETHATEDTTKLWKREWGGNAYFCNGSQSSRGWVF